MSNTTRMRILMPITLMVIWIALVCLALPGFAVAAVHTGQPSAGNLSILDLNGEPDRE